MSIYLCKSLKELTDDDMRYVAKYLNCAVRPIGKVTNENRWDYWLDKKSDISKEDLAIVKEEGLVLLLNPKQSEQIKRLSESNDLSEYCNNMVHTGLKPDS